MESSGLDILQRYNAVIDCRNQRIYLTVPGEDAQAITQEHQSAAVIMRCRCESRIPARLK